MSKINSNQVPFGGYCRLVSFFAACLTSVTATGTEIDGLLEPHRTINISTVEPGLIRSLHVRQGDRVRAGDTVAKLDDSTYQVDLQLAEAKASSEGDLHLALAELRLRQARLDQLETLRGRGHATEQELDRARTEHSVAQARVTAQREQLHLHSLAADKARIHLQRRAILSPVDGLVTKIFARVGEYVSPMRPEVIAVVEVDPILAVFDVPAERLDQYKRGQEAVVRVNQATFKGQIESVSATIEAASHTVKLKVKLPNPQLKLRAGMRCLLTLDEPR